MGKKPKKKRDLKKEEKKEKKIIPKDSKKKLKKKELEKKLKKLQSIIKDESEKIAIKDSKSKEVLISNEKAIADFPLERFSPIDISLLGGVPFEEPSFNVSDTLLNERGVIEVVDLEDTVEEEAQGTIVEAPNNEMYSSKTENINYARPKDAYTSNNPSTVSYSASDTSGYSPTGGAKSAYDEVNRPDPTHSAEFYDSTKDRKVGEIIGRESSNLESKSIKLSKKDRKNPFNPTTYS